MINTSQNAAPVAQWLLTAMQDMCGYVDQNQSPNPSFFVLNEIDYDSHAVSTSSASCTSCINDCVCNAERSGRDRDVSLKRSSERA